LAGLCVAQRAVAGLQAWPRRGPPPLLLKSLGGGEASLADHAGRVLLVHFFATWCQPCRTELAALNALDRQLRPKGLSILTVDVGEPESRIRRFFEANPSGLAVLLDPDRRAMKAWGVDVLPTTFIVDRGSCPRWLVVGEHDWTAESTIAALEAALADTPTQTCNSEGDRP
jgi:thiol-disulfide isomerase/thioredoxin